MSFPTSVSTPDVTELDRKEFLNIIHTSSHTVASASLFSHNEGERLRKKSSPFAITFGALKSRFLYLNKRIRSLEQTNSELKEDHLVAQGEIGLLTDELHSTRINLYNEIDLRRKGAAQLDQAEKKLELAEKKILDLRDQVKRYGDFVSIMSKLGIDNPLYSASLSVMSRVEAEDALVDSIIEAAKDKHSPWARLLPAIVGPRSPSNYVSAINLTLQTRQNLRECDKARQYWKHTAQHYSENPDLLTPSSSQLSDLSLIDSKPKPMPKGYPKELEDMIDALNRGAIKTDLPIPHPEIDEMEDWLQSELSEEPSEILNASVASQTHLQQRQSTSYQPTSLQTTSLQPTSYQPTPQQSTPHHSTSRQPISFGNETFGILKKSDTLRKIGKQPAPAQQRVRFDIEEAEDTTEQIVSPPAMPSSSSHNLDALNSTSYVSTQSTGSDDGESDSASSGSSDVSSSRGTVTEQSIRDSTYTTPVTPTFPFSLPESQIVAPESSSTVERGIVLARENSPQLKSPSEHSLQPSPSQYSSSSSGSEYEESVIGFTSDESIARHSYQEVPERSEDTVVPQASSLTSTSRPSSKSLPRHNFVSTTVRDSAQPVASRPGSPKTPPRPKASSSSSPPSPSRSSPTKINRLYERTTQSQLSRRMASASPTNASSSASRLSSRFSDSDSDSDSRRKTPPPVVRVVSSRNTSPVQSRTPSPKKFSPSRLVVPQITYGKRPALQRIDPNVSAPSKSRNWDLAPSVHTNVDPFSSKPMRASAPVKDLSKRRGVIMMKNLNIESSVITSASKTARVSTVTPNICEMEISNPPVFVPSVSSESLASTPAEPTVMSSTREQAAAPYTPPAVDLPLDQNACSELRDSVSATGFDSSSYDSQISVLVASMSDSDLGSLEMTDESDSDAETLGQVVAKRSTLNTLPRVCKDIMDGPCKASTSSRGGSTMGIDSRRVSSDLTPIASSSRLPSSIRPPQRLISATFGASTSSDSMPTSTSSSSSSSSGALESPTRRMSTVPQPTRIVLGHRSTRSGSISTPVKVAPSTPTAKPALSSVSSLPRPTLKPTTPLKSGIPSPQKFRLGKLAPVVAEPATVKKGKERAQDLPSAAVQPASKFGKRLASKLPSPTESASRASKQQKGATDPSPARETKGWMGQGIFSKFTKPHSSSSSTSPASEKASKSSLSPNGSTVSPVKPRSNTIATVVPSLAQPSARPALPTEPSTKPRSNTVNTYSPVTRSPLSQHVTNNSVDSQSLSSIRSSARPAASSSQPPGHGNKPKSVISSRITQPTGLKPPTQLHYGRRPGGSQATGQDAGPSPPSAAFMVKSKAPARRRVDSSVTPLIPSSANGIISPSQCRSLLRNTLSLAVR